MSDFSSSYQKQWLINQCANILEDKTQLIQNEVFDMLTRTSKMFEWKNLPDTIPKIELEKLIQINGTAIFKKVGDKYYVFRAGLGGVPNVYYRPTRAIIANPYLKYNADLEIDVDCVAIDNDIWRRGLIPMLNKYASLIAECLISIRWATINSRMPFLLDADNDNTKEEMEDMIEHVILGDKLTIIGHNVSNEGAKTLEYSANRSTTIRDLIETLQYLKAHWYNDLGIQSNYNMKREAISAGEAALGEDALVPLIDQMLDMRKEACEKINKMYGLQISVELSSVWKQLREEMSQQLEKTNAEIQDLKEGETNEIKSETGAHTEA